MLFRSVSRTQKQHDGIDRCAIQGGEIHAATRAAYRRRHLLDAFMLHVGDGHALTESGASLILAGCAGEPEAPSAPAEEAPPATQVAAPPPPAGGVTAVATHVTLSPQAQFQAETFMCVCGCEMRLGDCTCQEDPGSVTMKRYLQELVEQGMTPSQVRDAMVEKYGPAVLP